MGEWEHRILEKRDNRTGICSKCGEVKLSVGGRCRVKINETSRQGKYRRLYGVEHNTRPLSCEICGGKNRVAYDHNHQTGKFRGWLCMKCNTALGLVNEDVEILKKLIAYLAV